MNAPSPQPAISRTMTPVQWLMLIILSMLWGGSFLFLGVAVSELPVFTVIALRVGIAAVILYVAMRIAGETMPRDRAAWTAFIVMGFLNNVIPFTLLGFGQSHIASGLAAILTAATPLIGNLTAHFTWHDEALSVNRIIGMVLGLIGVGIMFLPSLAGGFGVNVLAELACLGAAVAFGLSGVYGRTFGKLGISPLKAGTGTLFSSSVVMIVLALLFDQPWNIPVPAPHIIAAVIGLAVLSTAVAYIIYFNLLRQVGATNTLLVTILMPAFAVIYGAILLAERLEPRHFLGFAIVAIGLAATDGRVWGWIRGRTKAA
jgi:drug/metabolite transporter (DMT)-like permease